MHCHKNNCHHHTSQCSRAVCCAVTLAVRGSQRLKEAARQSDSVVVLPCFPFYVPHEAPMTLSRQPTRLKGLTTFPPAKPQPKKRVRDNQRENKTPSSLTLVRPSFLCIFKTPNVMFWSWHNGNVGTTGMFARCLWVSFLSATLAALFLNNTSRSTYGSSLWLEQLLLAPEWCQLV